METNTPAEESAMSRGNEEGPRTTSEDTMDTEASTRPMSKAGAAMDASDSDKDEASKGAPPEKIHYGWRFWAIFPALCVTTLLAAVETTVTSTALPTISDDLHAAEVYVWFVNAYLLTSTSFQPLFGQTANIFGRRWLMIGSVAIFALGSGISGGAKNPATLIGGRAVQGIGGGGINVMIDIIISDLIPLRERGKFLGIIFAVFALGTSIGPFVGGIIVQRTTWRWVFYINLPIAGVSLVMLLAFLQVKYKRTTTVWGSIKRIDYTGNAILTAAIVAILIALSWGGTKYSWQSYHVLVPLLIGFVGIALFTAYEASGLVAEPTMPPHLFHHRTTVAAFGITFIHAMLTFWIIYFLPVYFQSVLGSSTTRSGVQLLPTVILAVPMAIVGGGLLTKFGRYRPLHFFSFGTILLGLGLFTLLNSTTSEARWVIFQIVPAFGVGILLTTLLPAVQVELKESDVAVSTATWSFIKSFGSIWGISIPSAIFNSQFTSLLPRVSDPAARAALSGGAAYSSLSRTLIESFGPQAADEIISVYSDSIKLTWQVALGFAGLGFLLVFFEKEVKLRTELETEYGLKEQKKTVDAEKAVDPADAQK